MRRLFTILLLAAPLMAQVYAPGVPQATPNLDLAGAGVPTMNCTVTQRYYQTDATAGFNLWTCTAANVWTRGAGGCISTPVTITATGATNWVKVPGCTRVTVTLWGAGGSGGRVLDASAGGGGGGGACVQTTFEYSALANPVVVTIGAGGAARTVDGTPGAVGENSTFGAYLTAYGGGGGGAYASNPGGGGGGGGSLSAGITAPVTSFGGDGGSPLGGIGPSAGNAGPASTFGGGAGGGSAGIGGFSYWGGGGGGGGSTTNTEKAGGNSFCGGGGGGGGSDTGAGAAGGTSVLGGAGGAGNTSPNAASAGVQPGGGGGGSENANSGAGADGQATMISW